MGLTIAIIGAVAAVGAAWAATGSWLAARKANQTAASVAAIERERRHDELAPEFEITCRSLGPPPAGAELYIALTGGRLERYDAVTVSILDEARRDHWGHGLPEGVTQEEAQAFVWGPWEFNAMASAQVVSNRETRPRAYSRVSGKNWDLLALVHTRPGPWMGSMATGQWLKQWDAQPVRLLVTCRCDGYEPWFIQRDIKVEEDPPASASLLPADQCPPAALAHHQDRKRRLDRRS